MTRYVFDTNVIVSALLFNASKPGLAFLEALDRGTILASAKLLTELNDVLSRPKFGRYIDPEERERFLGEFVREVRFVEIAKQFALVGIPRTTRSWNWLVTGVMLLLIVLPFAFIITTYDDVANELIRRLELSDVDSVVIESDPLGARVQVVL